MTQTTIFDSATPRYALPLLFPGQAQKEFFVNEAHVLIDALLHMSVEGVAITPPASPIEGECWLVDIAPTGEWANHGQEIACFISGQWKYLTPTDGMRIFDRSQRRFLLFDTAWKYGNSILPPTGGTMVDAEARQAIADLISALQDHAILPTG